MKSILKIRDSATKFKNCILINSKTFYFLRYRKTNIIEIAVFVSAGSVAE